MKKQTKSNIKAHLIRSSFYVLLLLAVCVIPFALAQRNTTRRAMTKPKLAANSARAATSQLRNDAPEVKGKVKTASNRFSTSSAVRKASPEGVACLYGFTPSAAPFVPGVDDIGNHTDDGLTFITLPFTVNLYGSSFTGANVGSNGALFFGSANATFGITCPPPFGVSGTTDALGPYWATNARTLRGAAVARAARLAESSPPPQAPRPTGFSTSNGVLSISIRPRRYWITRLPCMRTAHRHFRISIATSARQARRTTAS